MPLPVALGRYVVDLAEPRSVLRPQHLLDLGLAPDVELALLALAVGIERGREPATLGDHLPLQPGDGLLDARLVQLAARLPIDLRHQVDEQGVVVEHLLEVRHQPALVHRVAREAAAQVVVDAALADVGERRVHRLQGRRMAVADGEAPQQPEVAPLRELGRPGKAAAAAIDRPHHGDDQRGEPGIGQVGHGAAVLALLQRLHQQPGVELNLVGLLAVDARHLGQHGAERRPAEARLRRKIGAAPERLRVAVEEHGQRPAAVLAQAVQRPHVDSVDVGPLLAVHLDIDEQLVHLGRRRRVLEALVRHHVAPVAGRVAHGEEDRLAGPLRLRQRLRPPRPPVHRVVLVLQQIRAGLATEPVLGSGGIGIAHRASGRIHNNNAPVPRRSPSFTTS